LRRSDRGGGGHCADAYSESDRHGYRYGDTDRYADSYIDRHTDSDAYGYASAIFEYLHAFARSDGR
jgi:hypothetical protein